MEKAHPDVLNVLLQVLDDGRLTDGQARTVDFSYAVVILTSNIGAHKIVDSMRDIVANSKRETVDEDAGLAIDEVTTDKVLAEVRYYHSFAVQCVTVRACQLRSRFVPEFLNRLEQVVVFNALSRGQLAHIVPLQLRFLEKSMADDAITLEMTKQAIAVLQRQPGAPQR